MSKTPQTQQETQQVRVRRAQAPSVRRSLHPEVFTLGRRKALMEQLEARRALSEDVLATSLAALRANARRGRSN